MEFGDKEHIDRIIEEHEERLGFRENHAADAFKFAIFGAGASNDLRNIAKTVVPFDKPSDTPLFMAYDPAVPDCIYLDFGRMGCSEEEYEQMNDWRDKYGRATSTLPDESLLELAFSPTGEAARLVRSYQLLKPGSTILEADAFVQRFLTAFNASGLRNTVDIERVFNMAFAQPKDVKLNARELRKLSGEKPKFSSRVPIKLK